MNYEEDYELNHGNCQRIITQYSQCMALLTLENTLIWQTKLVKCSQIMQGQGNLLYLFPRLYS